MKKKILLLMSGSIACAKVTGLISAWAKAGHDVRVACTRSVGQFIGHATIEGFSGNPVLGDAFEPGRVMDHIHLARWADIVVAAPATSNLINKLSTGIADDVVTSLWQAAWGREKPMVLVPAMNSHMWEYPATVKNLGQLRDWGVHVFETTAGDLACGEQGTGRMLEIDEIQSRIDLLLTPRRSGRRILITAGGTREPIDSVRYIGNLSSGRTAARLCDSLLEAGHEVCWLGAESAHRPERPCNQRTYSSFKDLQREMQHLLQNESWDAVIHAAAVSDYSVDAIHSADGSLAIHGGKLGSSSDLTLHLKPNPKLLDQVRSWSRNPDVWIIGFKLTDTPNPEQRSQAILNLFERAGVDAVVHNDLSEIGPGHHAYSLHLSPQQAEACASVEELGQCINNRIGQLAS